MLCNPQHIGSADDRKLVKSRFFGLTLDHFRVSLTKLIENYFYLLVSTRNLTMPPEKLD
jgi:hypothetical protein